MKRKILGLILAICMLIGCAPDAVNAAESGDCGENLTWTLDNGTLTISGTGKMTDWDWSAASSAPWYNRSSEITNLVIEDGVTSIGEYSFLNYGALSSISIPQSVERIGEGAFSFCDNLASIDVDENNKNYISVDNVLFDKEQTSLIHYAPKKEDTAYTIPDSVERIENDAFSGSKNLETIDIPDSVNYIGEYAFETCSNLTSLTIPDGVTAIYQWMAWDCEKLSSIKFPDSITRIDMYAIGGTAYYKDPSNWIDGVLYVDNCLIEARRDIVSGEYQIKDGTVMIADVAFYECGNLTGVSIPDSVNCIGDCAFKYTAFYNDESNWTDNALYIDNCLVNTKKDLLPGDYRIADGTRLIADYAFSGAEGITSITIPKSVTRISDEAFYMRNKKIDLTFTAPDAVKLSENMYFDDISNIYIHEDYTGYASENGYDESKIVIEPHSYEDGVCSVCGAEKPKIERIDSNDDTEYSFSVNMGQAYEDCNVYAAVYGENGALLSVKSVPLGAQGDAVVSIDKSENDKMVKVFVWMKKIQPVEIRKFM